VLTVTEAATSAQTGVRSLLIFANDAAGRRWPLLDCPIKLSETPAAVQRPIGTLGEANDEVLQRLERPAATRDQSGQSVLRA
jgi:crotonobetainyl-CoA:carnitine CoA-transferase CaiB-like acyl-CoA transferase